MDRHLRLTAAPAALALVATLALAACTSSGDGASQVPAPSRTVGTSASSSTPRQTVTRTDTDTATVTRSMSAPPDVTSAGSTPTPGTGHLGGACRNDQLAISASQGNGASQKNGYRLYFRDVADVHCHLHGYPGADLLAANGDVLAHATRTLHGFFGGSDRGIPDVDLAPGQVASAVLEFATYDAAHPAGNCPGGPTIAVTAANTTRAVRLPRGATTCGLQVHPTVPGRTGQYPTP